MVAKIERETGVAVIPLTRGADLEFTVNYEDDDGNAIDITGYSASLKFYRHDLAETVDLELTSGGGEVTINGSAGEVKPSITDTNIDTLITAWGKESEGFYTLTITSSSGTDTRLLEGPVTLYH